MLKACDNILNFCLLLAGTAINVCLEVETPQLLETEPSWVQVGEGRGRLLPKRSSFSPHFNTYIIIPLHRNWKADGPPSTVSTTPSPSTGSPLINKLPLGWVLVGLIRWVLTGEKCAEEQVLYSGKLSFANWLKLRLSRRKFHGLLTGHVESNTLPNFVEKTFANSHRPLRFASLESFPF